MAHYELGWLDDEKAADPAGAIFHYQEYLKLNPSADNADVIKQRIYRCKQQLAADVLPLPSAPAVQQQLDRLSDQNRQLLDEVGKWRAYYANQLTAAKTNPAPPVYDTPQPEQVVRQRPRRWSNRFPPRCRRETPFTSAPLRSSSGAAHAHKVVAGETAVTSAANRG